MSTFVAKDCTIWMGGYDLTADVNSVDVDTAVAEVECTTFGSSGHREYKPGLKTTKVELGTYLNTAATEPALDAINGTADNVFSVSGEGAGALQVVYFGRALGGSLKRGAKIGDMFTLDGSFVTNASEGLVRGLPIVPKTTTSGTGTTLAGTGVYGAVAATQSAYAALHVFSVAGTSTPTLAVKLQSDTVGFGSATDVITFTNATAVGAEFKSVAGANTDTYWRVSYAITGTSPIFSFAVVFGIQ